MPAIHTLIFKYDKLWKQDDRLKRFEERFPDVDLFFHLYTYWERYIKCETREQLEELLNQEREEGYIIKERNRRQYEERNKDQKTSLWRKLFGD